jgi:hypothetical protein
VSIPVLPDVEAVVIGYLKASSSVTAIVPAARIRGMLPAGPPWPFLTVHRVGGAPSVEQWLDSARIEVQAWSDSAPQANLLARTVRAALHNMTGVYTGGVVTGVDDDVGPQMVPADDLTPAPFRYVATYTVHAHP